MTVLACLRVFSVDACVTAGHYALGCGRDEVTADDMRRALMYQARKFFEQTDAELLRA